MYRFKKLLYIKKQFSIILYCFHNNGITAKKFLIFLLKPSNILQVYTFICYVPIMYVYYMSNVCINIFVI